MELIVTLNGKAERVSVERIPGGYRVQRNGRELEVDWRELGPVVRSLRLGGLQHELTVLPAGPQRWSLGLQGSHFEVEVVSPLVHRARLARGEKAGARRQVIRAYMPGWVVQVNVAVGDEVSPGQALVVLEAMKMQNELQAEAAGRVVAVHVAAGAAVEGGDPLVELE
jgi:biotin carboxyl carrier protein